MGDFVVLNLGLKGKKAFISGGSRGIGLATAKALASEGCDIAICGRDPDSLEAARVEISSIGDVDCQIYKVDVLKKEEIKNSFAEIEKDWGGVDILINNVGGGGRWGIDDFLKNPDDVWLDVYDKNFTSTLLYTRYAVPYMKNKGWGRVITITSTLGRQAGGRPWFNVAKTSQTCLMKNLSLNKELVRSGITFNSVAPGCIMIPRTGWEKERNRDPIAFQAMIKERFPLGRMGKPEEVAHCVLMLCSKGASLINGAAIPVDGGESFAF